MFGRADPIRCSMGLLGRSMARFPNGTMSVSACNFVKGPLDPITGLVDQRCKYYPYPYHNRGFESMMDHQWIKEVRIHHNLNIQNHAIKDQKCNTCIESHLLLIVI